MRFKTRSETKEIPCDRQIFTRNHLLALPELHPPSFMPNGNVGTPTKYFLRQIQLCKLPPGVIKKLGLVFPRMRTNRRYGCVPFSYGGDVIKGDSNKEVCSGTGHEIYQENMVISNSTNSHKDDTKSDENEEAQESESDADDCEEWERHEALHDDPSNQDRNEERLYENDMEIVWEKGGPGIVWYTDAQFWDQQAGGKLFEIKLIYYNFGIIFR